MASRAAVDRIEETRDGLARLQRQMRDWFVARRAADEHHQYWTQLNSLERVLDVGAARLCAAMEGLPGCTSANEIYAECRVNDRRVYLLHQYWRYFADKWDQRDSVDGNVLKAADEVIWSCWTQPYGAADLNVTASPLPYLEASYMPRAIPRTSPPSDIRRTDPLLREALEVLPIPLIALPTVVQTRPWWLAVVAHEISHHLQRDFAGGVYQSRFEDVIEQAATAAGTSTGSWKGWHEEVFADIASVLLIGPAGALATTEMLRDTTARMFLPSRTHPALVVRWQLMASVLAAGGATGATVPLLSPLDFDDDELAAVSEQLRSTAEVHIAAADRVAAAAMEEPVDGRFLPQMLGWRPDRFTAGGEAEYWRDELLQADVEPVPESLPHTARTALAGGVAAWKATVQIEDAARRADALDRLAERLRLLLTRSRPPGKRDGRLATTVDATASNPLVGAMFGAEIETDFQPDRDTMQFVRQEA